MKPYLLVLYILIAGISFGQLKELKAYSDFKTYYSPQDGNYIEIQLQFIGASLLHKKTSVGLQAEIGIELTMKKGEKTIISDAYRLVGPVVRDSIFDDFYDIKRFAVDTGDYDLRIKLWDLNTNQKEVYSTQKVNIKNPLSQYSLSEIQVCESIKKTKEENVFSKSGVDIIPYIGNYFSSACNTLPIYFEIYNKTKDSTSIKLIQNIQNSEVGSILNDYHSETMINLASVQPIIKKIDISSLPTGKYNLSYTLQKDNKIIQITHFDFDRTNDIYTPENIDNILIDPAFQQSIPKDSVLFSAKSLMPITKNAEQANLIKLIKENDTTKILKYIQSYWILSSGKLRAYDNWLNYKKQVILVEKLYKTNLMHGFETDRGIVYLKYGSPNAIATRETSPSEYPYEIWQYDKIKQFSNKRFIFYNPDLVNNNYRLLHSDMIGELKNPRWQSILTKRNSPTRDIDDPNDGNFDHFGGESQDVFKQF
jgi:GWxTD domain-containing protein